MNVNTIRLDLAPETFELVRDATIWYHETLHMVTNPAHYEPQLPIESLDHSQKTLRLIRCHRFLNKLEAQLPCSSKV